MKTQTKLFYLITWIGIQFILVNPISAEIPAAYVDIGYGARPTGMGGAYVALSNDAHSVIWNPAGLVRLNQTNATFMWTKQFSLIPYYFFAAGHPINKSMAVGLAVISSGNEVLRENTAYLSFAYQMKESGNSFLSNIGFGMNLKFRNSSFGNNKDGGEERIQGDAFGFGLDLGLQWKISSKLLAGLMLRDIVSPVSYNNETLDKSYTESVPTTLILGFVTPSISNMLLTLDWNKVLSEGNDDKIHAGFEYKIINLIAIRAGFSQAIESKTNRKYNLGLGILHKQKGKVGLSFDFTYEFFYLANTPKVSTSIWF